MDNLTESEWQRQQTVDAGEHAVGTDGWYKPLDYWLSVCGIYELYRYLLDLLGELSGKTILDCGSGRGHVSVMLAKHGALVRAFDTSDPDLSIGRTLAEKNRVEVEFLNCPFEELPYGDESFDLVAGTFVLHHVDIARSSRELNRVLRPGGRAVFIENSDRNPILMLCRRLLCGSFGVPKYGDDTEEHPLTCADIQILKKHFNGVVTVHFPSLVFFRLLDFYIFQKQSSVMTSLLYGLDNALGAVSAFRRFSYFQVLQLDKRE